MSESTILYEAAGSIATITLNRPEKRNALNQALIEELGSAILSAESDPDVRAVVIRGAGRDFCSGADLASMQTISENSAYDNLLDAEKLAGLFIRIRNLSKPVIAAVHGRALAGGCGLASACDIVLASESALFGYTEVRIGFVPAMVMAILRRNVSEKIAFELLAGGQNFSAQRAAEVGLVNQVFEDANFDDDVRSFAESFAANSATAIALTKRLLYNADSVPFESALRSGAAVNAIARTTEDCKKGIEKFLKKT